MLAALWALTGVALATPVPQAAVGKLPGFPRVRGVQPVLGSQAQVKAREKLVNSAFAAARAHRADGKAPVPNGAFTSPCVSEAEAELAFLTQEPCYRGGPVLRGPSIHLIFWQGPLSGVGREESVEAFPSGYVEAIERYFANVSRASGSITDDFAVDSEYFSMEGSLQIPGEYSLHFKTKSEIEAEEAVLKEPLEPFSYMDRADSFPNRGTPECGGPTVDSGGEEDASAGPCLLDEDLHEEVKRAATAEHWSLESLTSGSRAAGNVFVLITPPGVGGCFAKSSAECAYTSYCAYHGDFGGNGETVGGQSVYENLPYIGGVGGCEIFKVRPNGVAGADAAIDTANHETNEAITDPLGSQCDEVAKKLVGCEPFSWTDEAGQEIADKCLPPETPLGLVYGEPLGTLDGGEEGLYNESISGGHYWTQTLWSLAASTDGGCVQRIVHTSFPEPASAAATIPTTFDGSQSGEAADPVVRWAWSFGDGTAAASSQSSISHTYSAPGSYFVTLTAYDTYGNSHTFTREVQVGEAPPATTTTTTTTSTTSTVGTTRYGAAQIAKLIGLPANGRRLSGAGTISFGHASCPPACGVQVRLIASVRQGRHTRRILLASLKESIAKKSTKSLSLRLTAKGMKLLRSARSLAITLFVRVEDSAGASWSIQRHLTLTSAGGAGRVSRR